MHPSPAGQATHPVPSGPDDVPGASRTDVPPAAIRTGDLLAGLNPAQREAVCHENGPLFILPARGSGKTRVITRRIAWLAIERGVDPWRILAITFTNKAAREMRERVEAILPARGMWISTFHSMCARICGARSRFCGRTRATSRSTTPTTATSS
jgi:DNA helicase-2/ATP-dependent DNA helicase PcrA